MLKKNGLFKKILTPEGDPSEEAAAEVTTVDPKEPSGGPGEIPSSPAGRQNQLPPPRPPERRSKSHDPFEDDVNFGFTPEDGPQASDTRPSSPPISPKNSAPDDPEDAEPTTPAPTFAMPEEKQMSQHTIPIAPPPDSESIPQLELRAIFGVDHAMNEEQILERCRNLKNIRHISRLADGDAGTIDALKSMISRLGFGGDPVQIYAGSVPVEFIREGNIALAVKTDGGFAPGVRETLIIVARELAKI